MTFDQTIHNMTSQISPAVSSALNQVKEAAVWMGRQIVVLASSVPSTISKSADAIYGFAKQIVAFATPYFASAQNFILSHKDLSIAASVGALAGITGYALATHILSTKQTQENI